MRIMGIDPSMCNFGCVVADLDLDTEEVSIIEMRLLSPEAGPDKKVVRKNSDDLRRACEIYGGFQQLCRVYGVRMGFVEVPVGSQSARAMASYGMCIGILASAPMPMIQVTPSEVKKVATGRKDASKDEMIQAARKLHPGAGWLTRRVKGEVELLGKNEHLADACWAIQAGLATDQWKALRTVWVNQAALAKSMI